MKRPNPKTVLAFGLGSLVVPVVELATFRLVGRNPLDPQESLADAMQRVATKTIRRLL